MDNEIIWNFEWCLILAYKDPFITRAFEVGESAVWQEKMNAQVHLLHDTSSKSKMKKLRQDDT